MAERFLVSPHHRRHPRRDSGGGGWGCQGCQGFRSLSGRDSPSGRGSAGPVRTIRWRRMRWAGRSSPTIGRHVDFMTWARFSFVFVVVLLFFSFLFFFFRADVIQWAVILINAPAAVIFLSLPVEILRPILLFSFLKISITAIKLMYSSCPRLYMF